MKCQIEVRLKSFPHDGKVTIDIPIDVLEDPTKLYKFISKTVIAEILEVNLTKILPKFKEE
jgi:hypothetical protein